MHFSYKIFTILNLLLCFNACAQRDSSGFFTPSRDINKNRIVTLVSSETALYGGLTLGLNSLWYKGYQQSSFHFFNDGREWLQMDKMGHIATSYYFGRLGMSMMNWAGMERKKAIWYGGVLGFVFLSTVEVQDGFSSAWGFSPEDLAANTLGSAILIAQEIQWKEQRIVLKFSFHQSQYAFYRPQLLGRNYAQNFMKDYNGQTYWASFNISSFLKKENSFPKWLNVDFGYGAEGMTGANANPVYIDKNGKAIRFERYRQYYLSLDVDLCRIKTKSAFLKGLFTAFGFVKIPGPTLEFNKNGMSFKSIYF